MMYSMFMMVFLMVMQYHMGCAAPGSNKFTLQEVLSPYVIARPFNGTWISGTEFMYTESLTGNVMLYNVTSESASLLVERNELADYNKTMQILSPDGRYLLIGYDRQQVFRHSFVSRFVLYDLSNKVFIPVHGGELLQKVILAPQGNALAYVFKNNVYYMPIPEGLEYQITFTGECGVIYNGIPDWVYEEEVTGLTPVMSFSPDSRWLYFITFNDTNVKTEALTVYGKPGAIESQYSNISKIHYPKPGTPIPTASIYLVDLKQLRESRRLHIVDIPAPIETVTEENIAQMHTWISDEELVLAWTNRVQNVAVIETCSAATGRCKELYKWTEKDGWVTVPRILFDNKGRVVMVLPQPQGPGEGNFDHLTLLNRKDTVSEAMFTETPLTRGRLVVTAIYGWDQVNDIIYYQATPEDEPAQLHVYALSIAENGSVPQCLSCKIKTLEGNFCQYAYAYFSTDLSHVAVTCTGPDPAQVFLLRAGLAFDPVTTWDNNTELREFILGKSMPIQKDLKIPIEDGMFAQVRLYLPPDADLSGNTKYPLLVFVYAGPNSYQLKNEFGITWQTTYLVTNRNIICATIDGRGSGLKGNKMKFSVYRRLGTNEIYDQINVTRHLQNTYAYIDAKRTGIWGWSYGGYATAMALARDDKDIFKCGVSVAPVTSWIYYDSTYTERYMGLPTPEDNLEGYNNGDVTRLTEGFRNKSFFLIHGNADDNVHYLQAMILSRALELRAILFRQQSYPNEDHSLRGVKPHLYLSMEQFWTRCFGL